MIKNLVEKHKHIYDCEILVGKVNVFTKKTINRSITCLIEEEKQVAITGCNGIVDRIPLHPTGKYT